MKDQGRLYGLTEMEILLELECGIDVEFEPDWVPTENCGDHYKVQWQLSDSPNTRCLDDVFGVFSKKLTISQTGDSMEGMRLLCRRDKAKIDT